jgi:DNA polymerase phi
LLSTYVSSEICSRQKAQDEEEAPLPVEVLVDILISFLAKPSAVLRSLSIVVFKVFAVKWTTKF